MARLTPVLPEIMRADERAVRHAAKLIHEGAVVAYPTETCYGLGARALDPEALKVLFRVKGRDEQRAISVLVSDAQMLSSIVTTVSPLAQWLIANYWPGALTIVLPARPGLPKELVSERGGIGVRMSLDAVANALVHAVGEPITATSANRSGDTGAREANYAALEGVALVLDGGVRMDPPSTVVELIAEPRILRQGAVFLAEERLRSGSSVTCDAR